MPNILGTSTKTDVQAFQNTVRDVAGRAEGGKISTADMSRLTKAWNDIGGWTKTDQAVQSQWMRENGYGELHGALVQGAAAGSGRVARDRLDALNQ